MGTLSFTVNDTTTQYEADATTSDPYFALVGFPGSPDISSIVLPGISDSSFAGFQLSYQVGGGLSAVHDEVNVVTYGPLAYVGVDTVTLPMAAGALWITPLDTLGDPVAPASFAVRLTFASAGSFGGLLTGSATPIDLHGAFSVTDRTTGVTTQNSGTHYLQSVPGPTQAYINLTPDNLDVVATIPDAFIYAGSGMDSLTATSGTNLIDSGINSNFMTGGSGSDTFYLDARTPAAAPIFSTIADFHAGDSVTVWGITPSDFQLTVLDNQGAPGTTGLDLLFHRAGQPDVSFVLAGYTSADLTNRRLSVDYNRTPDMPDLPGSNYVTVHAG